MPSFAESKHFRPRTSNENPHHLLYLFAGPFLSLRRAHDHGQGKGSHGQGMGSAAAGRLPLQAYIAQRPYKFISRAWT